MELPADIYEKLTALAEQGDEYEEQEDFAQALAAYNEALALLPEPKQEWEAATWLYTAIGDAHINQHDWDEGLVAFQQALASPEGTENPYIWFSLGQIFFEQVNLEEAKMHFSKAHELDGEEIFQDENPAYLALVQGDIF